MQENNHVLTLNNDAEISNTVLRIHDGFLDGIKFVGNTTLTCKNMYIIDTRATESVADIHHSDALQIIPIRRNAHWSNYSLASVRHICIDNVDIWSKNELQGIFCGDGLVDYISVKNSTINTLSAHKITLAGVLSGDFVNNNHPVLLLPARIGGWTKQHGAVWIKSFSSESSKDYQEVTCDYNDVRQHQRSGTNLTGFDYDSFRAEVDKIDSNHYYSDVHSYCAAVQELAIKHSKKTEVVQ